MLDRDRRDRLHCQLKADESNDLDNVMRSAAERTVGVIRLTRRMRVSDLDDAGEQHERDAENPQQSEGRPRRSRTGVQTKHVIRI